MELKQHPLSAAFPAMSADDFAALVGDIKANGQREPVTLHEGMVLDGWHRYQACIQLGIKPQQFKFDETKDPVAFVLSENLHRRHLTASQRAAAVVACTEWAPANRPSKVEPSSTFSKNKDLAKAAGVTPRTITDAKAAHKAGLSESVKEGAMTAKEAAKVARGKPDPAPPPKTAKPAANAPTVAAPKQEDLDDAREAVHILSEENERLSDRLAVEAMEATAEEKARAAETIAELRGQVKTLAAELKAVKASRDSYMRENGELKKQCAAQRRELDKRRAA